MVSDQSLGTGVILEDREITSSPSMVLCFVLGNGWKEHGAPCMKTKAITELHPPLPHPFLLHLYFVPMRALYHRTTLPFENHSPQEVSQIKPGYVPRLGSQGFSNGKSVL